MRGDRRSFRGAVAASVAIHAALAVVLIVAGRWAAHRPAPPRPPGIDTRAAAEPRIEVRFDEEPPAVEVAVSPEPRGADVPRSPDPPAEPSPPTGSRPEVVHVPATLPPELLALMRKPQPVGPAVVEVPLTPTRMNPPPTPGPSPPRVQPVVHASTPAPAGGASTAAPVRPVHGALGAGQTIVYVLDMSGSMGEWGKFAKARAALVAALRTQPPTVRFQVVVYAGTADFPLPAPVGGCVPATADHIDQVEAALVTVAPAGRSDHAAGLRLAVSLRPDFVLILTDANDLSAARLRGVVAQAGRPVKVCVAKVGAEGVGEPVELR
jgi:hypothetical protein